MIQFKYSGQHLCVRLSALETQRKYGAGSLLVFLFARLHLNVNNPDTEALQAGSDMPHILHGIELDIEVDVAASLTQSVLQQRQNADAEENQKELDLVKSLYGFADAANAFKTWKPESAEQ